MSPKPNSTAPLSDAIAPNNTDLTASAGISFFSPRKACCATAPRYSASSRRQTSRNSSTASYTPTYARFARSNVTCLISTPHLASGHVDSFAPAHSALRAFAFANSFHRIPSGSSLPIRCGEGILRSLHSFAAKEIRVHPWLKLFASPAFIIFRCGKLR